MGPLTASRAIYHDRVTIVAAELAPTLPPRECSHKGAGWRVLCTAKGSSWVQNSNPTRPPRTSSQGPGGGWGVDARRLG